ncbi:flavodoxin family protein [Lewinella sp. 4G2]|uniref:flavodoxin family protein n=1 Tax=Lewinella sp. 4G2 TaxID=1803372 RepID=UPI0007B4814D|nr:NAD(P)H-dependent oxidoreductase [Lewinella sp. 4G2]OAV43068.1 hypothetical protein A3850_000490 [Lewinella sp. 4G2]
MGKDLIIQASARADGDTFRVVEHLAAKSRATTIDLLDFKIYPFRYDQDYPEDDQFLGVFRYYILGADEITLATPIYWYTMSGLLKNFLDRFSDLLITHKELGRQLRGKELVVVSVGQDKKVPPSFYDPFFRTAEYLGMDFFHNYHAYLEDEMVVIEKQLPF